MKKIKCPICGTENRTGMKYCRICFSRLTFVQPPTLLKTSFYSRVQKQKSFITLGFIILLLFILWLLLR